MAKIYRRFDSLVFVPFLNQVVNGRRDASASFRRIGSEEGVGRRDVHHAAAHRLVRLGTVHRRENEKVSSDWIQVAEIPARIGA